MRRLFLVTFLIIFSCDSYNNLKPPKQTIETITLLGDTLRSPEIENGKSFDQFKSAQITYFDNENNAEALIWYGRRAAYLGYYKEAIKLFSISILDLPKKYPIITPQVACKGIAVNILNMAISPPFSLGNI